MQREETFKRQILSLEWFPFRLSTRVVVVEATGPTQLFVGLVKYIQIREWSMLDRFLYIYLLYYYYLYILASSRRSRKSTKPFWLAENKHIYDNCRYFVLLTLDRNDVTKTYIGDFHIAMNILKYKYFENSEFHNENLLVFSHYETVLTR